MFLTKSLLHTTDAYIKRLREAGIETVRDLLFYFPRDIEDKSDVCERFSMINIKEKQVIKCTIELLTSEITRNKKLLIKAVLTDADGSHAEAVWFNRRFLLQQFARGDTVLIYGLPKYEYGRLSFPSSEIEHVKAKRREIVPVYSDLNYIPGGWIREKILLLKSYLLEDFEPPFQGGEGGNIPDQIRKKRGMRSYMENVSAIHFPESLDDFERAKGELGYEELFHFQKRGLEKKYELLRNSEGHAPAIPLNTDLIKELIASLPYSLTNKQKIVLFQILKDMEKPHAMARMLQGDVGTGKTIVALLAAIHAIITSSPDPFSSREGGPKNSLSFRRGLGGGGLQVAIMAPTEILARQHFSGSEAWLMELGIRSDLLVGSLTPRMKEDARERLKKGETDIIFGTHALIQDEVQFARLGFVVVDEQHRFGVEQRKALEEYCSGNLPHESGGTHEANGRGLVISTPLARGDKGGSAPEHQSSVTTGQPFREGALVPHRLNMSATPIPRSLALTLYGDQDISVLDEYPAGRKPIHTRVVREDQRTEVYRWIDEQVREGRQVYWISPLVEAKNSISGGKTKDGETEGGKLSESDESKQKMDEASEFLSPSGPFGTFQSGKVQRAESKEDIASAVEMQIHLSAIFPEYSVGLIHGRMSGKEKDRIMQDFYENNIQILSSTSVVEVGVNNPNASIICIEAAERFGLSSLHQFRGRVGRGEHQSYCYLFTTKEYKTDRLKAMEKTNDGFELAQIDLDLRGPGEVYGVRQSGVPDMHFADLRDTDLIAEIREDIEEWMKEKSQK